MTAKNGPAEAGPTQGGYLPHDLSRVINALNLQLLEHLRPLELTPQQFRVLQVLAEHEPMSVGDVARIMVVDQSVVSRIVDQLRRRKLARKGKRSSNGRIVDASLTPAGRELATSLQAIANAIVADATSVLTADERSLMAEMLARIFNHVTAPRYTWLLSAKT